MILTIEEKQFETNEILQLYPAVVIKTGHKEETTQVSLEWIDTEAKGKVEIIGYGVFIVLKNEKKDAFIFQTREAMESEIANIALQLQ